LNHANINWHKLSKTAILLGMGIYFLVLILTGNLTNYINLRFAWVAYVGAAIFFLLGLVSLYGMLFPQEDDYQKYAGNSNEKDSITWKMLAIVAFPLLLALLIPSRSLGVESINGGISFNSVGVESATAFTLNPLDRNILDWLRQFNRSNAPAEFNGQQVDVIGFVYHEPHFLADEMMVARFTMSCCVADAFSIGLPIVYETAQDFTAGVWVRVQGELQADDFGEEFMPVVYATSVEVVDPPAQQYLYP
jgi:putative membrane protein